MISLCFLIAGAVVADWEADLRFVAKTGNFLEMAKTLHAERSAVSPNAALRHGHLLSSLDDMLACLPRPNDDGHNRAIVDNGKLDGQDAASTICLPESFDKKRDAITGGLLTVVCPFCSDEELDTQRLLAVRAVSRVVAQKITFLQNAKLLRHIELVQSIEKLRIPGLVIEAGVAHGGTSIILGTAKCPRRFSVGYDTYEGIPPPTREDPDKAHARFKTIKSGNAGKGYYGYERNLYALVEERMKLHAVPKISLIKGLFNNTLQITQPVAYAHLDCDWYNSVMLVLERVSPHVPIGGIVAADDYYTWGGATKAWDEFFSQRTNWLVTKEPDIRLVWARRIS